MTKLTVAIRALQVKLDKANEEMSVLRKEQENIEKRVSAIEKRIERVLERMAFVTYKK